MSHPIPSTAHMSERVCQRLVGSFGAPAAHCPMASAMELVRANTPSLVTGYVPLITALIPQRVMELVKELDHA